MADLLVAEGAYLTNGKKLFQVLRTFFPNGQVLLEDCADPGAAAVCCSVKELVEQGMTVVRPA